MPWPLGSVLGATTSLPGIRDPTRIVSASDGPGADRPEPTGSCLGDGPYRTEPLHSIVRAGDGTAYSQSLHITQTVLRVLPLRVAEDLCRLPLAPPSARAPR